MITKPTTSNAYITNWCMLDNVEIFVPKNNPTFTWLIKHTQEHTERGNRLRTDVVRCLTLSPRIIKSLNPSLVQDPVFMHILIKIIKPIDIDAQLHLQFPDDWWRLQISCCLSPLPCPRICWSTHTHTCTCLHNMFTLAHNTQKARFRRDQWVLESGKHKINLSSVFLIVWSHVISYVGIVCRDISHLFFWYNVWMILYVYLRKHRIEI